MSFPDVCGFPFWTGASLFLGSVLAGGTLAFAILKDRLTAFRDCVVLLDDAMKNDGKVDVAEAARILQATKLLVKKTSP